MSDFVKKRLESIVKMEANRLHEIALIVGLGDEDYKRLEILARAVRMMDSGDLPEDPAARSASVADLIASLGEPVA